MLKFSKIVIINSFLFSFILILIKSTNVLSDDKKSYVMYPLTAKELVVECEKWLPNQTAEQQKKKEKYHVSDIYSLQLILIRLYS